MSADLKIIVRNKLRHCGITMFFKLLIDMKFLLCNTTFCSCIAWQIGVIGRVKIRNVFIIIGFCLLLVVMPLNIQL